jgi:hypothetical protein
MAGYFGTPLPQKLGIKPHARVAFVDLPSDVKKASKDAISTCHMEEDGKATLDFAMVFIRTRSELRKELTRLKQQLARDGMLWVSWPKKASGVATDLTEDEVRKIGLQHGLVDVKVCAVSEVWSGLKFVRRLKDRPDKPKR